MLSFRARHLLFACLASLITAPEAGAAPLPVLRIQGSNTMGTELLPALVQGLFVSRGLSEVRTTPLGADNEWQVIGHAPQGPALQAEIDAHGTATGFAALATGSADLAAASRPIHPQEQAELYGAADPAATGTEQVIGIDGLAIIVHPGNPLRSLDAGQLANVFSGTVTRWEQLVVPLGPIHLYARDNRSGTWETFRDLVLAPRGLTLVDSAQRLESSAQLSSAVSQDPQAIGFIGLPYVLSSRALAIGDNEARPLAPTTDAIATEDYLLSRRLYLYTAPVAANAWATALGRFAQSEAGQRIVAEQGFVAQQIHAVAVQPAAGMPERYLALAREGRRLTVNFRFAGASASLDSKAMADIERLAGYLQDHPTERQQVVLVGFGDTKSEPGRAQLLSHLRAMTVRRELTRRGITPREVVGLGEQLPVASNAYESGRMRNRRVEVWVH
ncbi:phosphate ABC transporter substrate-binding/OmpA family protein [Pseudomonas sp. RIT-PI-S]|uniref:phosphate ABC transporter substrate-binding/OmpA family protein n=1 Tax=Pseudomonas sp. RIT-PI-S TaxID=3035295 RepID=UPI0021DB5092|nr:phosphate ABC transporter substrate-binding/OmpA family protein [Pseudomonas sp. RIT-PI-S]